MGSVGCSEPEDEAEMFVLQGQGTVASWRRGPTDLRTGQGDFCPEEVLRLFFQTFSTTECSLTDLRWGLDPTVEALLLPPKVRGFSPRLRTPWESVNVLCKVHGLC